MHTEVRPVSSSAPVFSSSLSVSFNGPVSPIADLSRADIFRDAKPVSASRRGRKPAAKAAGRGWARAVGLVMAFLAGVVCAPAYGYASANITLAPVINTVAGGGTGTCGGAQTNSVGDGCPANEGTLNSPEQAIFDKAGNMYIADEQNQRIRKVNASTGIISTVAGTGTQCPNGNYSGCGEGGPATSAKLYYPQSIAFDSNGNLYILDGFDGRIRVVYAAGTIPNVASPTVGNIYTVAGTGGNDSTTPASGVVATSATIPDFGGIALDSAGNIYIADHNNSTIRVVYVSGTVPNVTSPTVGYIYTIGGGGGSLGDNGVATSGQLSDPYDVAVDSAGNIYITDEGHNRIRMIASSGTNPYVSSTTAGYIYTVAGTGSQGYTGDGGAATSATLQEPYNINVDSAGNLYIGVLGNNVIRMVSAATRFISTVAGNGTDGFSGDNGPATSAELSIPHGATPDGKGNLYVADYGNNAIREITPNTNFGNVNVCPGSQSTPTPCSQTQTLYFSVPSTTTFGAPVILTQGASGLDFKQSSATCVSSVTGPGTCTVSVTFTPLAPGLRMGAVELVDGSGNVLISTPIQGIGQGPAVAFTPGIISSVAGNGTYGYSGDGAAATSAELKYPTAVALDGAGNLYIADYHNSVVRKVDAASGNITTVAGTGTAGYSGDGGLATSAKLNYPSSLAVDGAGNLYIADQGNDRTREVNAATGIISTVVGTGTAGYSGDGGPATSAKVHYPTGVAVDGAGNIYIVDEYNGAIREVNAATGIISTVAGNGTIGETGNGGPATSAELDYPYGEALDSAGNIYIADYYANTIRKVNAATGIISTVAGNGTGGYTGDGGPATSAELDYPYYVAVDSAGNIYIADFNNNVIREVNAATGIISTVAGNGTGGYAGDGGLATSAELYEAGSVTLDGAGNLYIADYYNNLIRKVTVASTSLSFAPTAENSTSSPISVTVQNIGNQTLSAVSPGLGFYTGTNFETVAGSGTPADCTTTFSLSPAASCNVSIEYDPVAASTLPLSDWFVITDNALNTSPSTTQNIMLMGTGSTTQTITVGTAAPSSAGYGSTFTVAATASSGLTVTFGSGGGCSNSGATFTMTSGATACSVFFSQAGDSTYAAATPVTESVSATQASSSVTVTCSSGPFTYNGSAQTPCSATVTGAGSLSETETPTYSNNTYPGTATASYTFAGDTNHTSSSGSTTFTIQPEYFVVTVSADDAGTASNCTPQTAAGSGTDLSCSLRDALLESAAAGGGKISFDSTAFATAKTIALTNGTLTVPTLTTITGPTATPNTSCGASVSHYAISKSPLDATAPSITTQPCSQAIGIGSKGIFTVVASGSGTLTYQWQYFNSNSHWVSFGAGTGTTTATMTTNATTAAYNGLQLRVVVTDSNGHSTTSSTATLSVGPANPTKNLVTVDGGSSSTVFTVGSTVTGAAISNLTIQNGAGSAGGGGVANSGALTLANDTVATSTTATNGGAISNSGTLTVSASTLNGNSSASNGGGIYNSGALTLITDTLTANSAVAKGGGVYNASAGTLTLTNDTLNTNIAISSGGGIYTANSAAGSVALANAIVDGNTNETAADDYDGTAYTNNNGNIVGVSNGGTANTAVLSLAPLGSYGGPTQTMVPLPGSGAICGGVVASLANGVTTDQRGLPNKNTTYPGYSSPACVDSGAVQTNYSLSFSTEPASSGLMYSTNFSAGVTLDESGSAFPAGSATIPLTLNGTGTLTGGSASTTGGTASYTLQVDTQGSGDTLTANLSLNSVPTTAVAISATSTSFNIGMDNQATTLTVTGVPGTAQAYGASFTVGSSGGSGTGAVTFSATGACSNIGTTVTMSSGTGTCSVTATKAADTSYNSQTSSASTVSATTASSAVTVTCSSATYTGSALTPCTATVNGTGGFSQSLTPSYSNNTNVGLASAGANFPGNTNFSSSIGGAEFSIGQASSSVAIDCTGYYTYNGSAQTPCTAGATGQELSQPLTVSYSSNTSAGTATASASFAGDTNHTGNSNSTTFTIHQASSTVAVSCTGGPFTYNGSPQTPSCTASVTGAGGLSQPVTPVTFSNNTNAGTATAGASFSGDTNHTGNTGSTTFTIGQAGSTVTVTCTAGPFTYTGSPLTPCSATSSTGAPLTPTYSNNTNVGTATASATFAGDTNDSGSSSSATFTIRPANFVVTVSTDDAGTASNCTPQTTSGTGTDSSCSLRDALLESTAAGGGYISFDSTHFASATTITLSNGTLNVPTTTTITGAITSTPASANCQVISANNVTGPTISAQPCSQTVPLSTKGTFSVTASGSGTLTYQWQYLNSNSHWVSFGAGTGTTTSSMTTNATTAAYNGLQLRVVVTDGNGRSTTSNTATLHAVPDITLANLVTVDGNTLYPVFTVGSGVTGSSISNLTIQNGHTSQGGAGINNSGALTLSASTVTGSSAAGTGGGIYNASAGSLTLTGDTLANNTAVGNGGGIYNAGALTLTSDTLDNNITIANGGGIYNASAGTVSLTASTVYGNSAIPNGGGIYNASSTASSVTLTNSIVSGNVNNSGNPTPDYKGASSYTDSGGNIVAATTGAVSLSTLGSYGGPTQTLVPLPGSTALCAISPSSATGYDQRGEPRMTTYGGTTCQDSGAVQSNYSLSFSTEPASSGLMYSTNFSAGVTLDESGSAFHPSVTIPLTLTGTGNLTGGSASTSSGVASYTLQVDTQGTGDTLTASLALSTIPAVSISATSSSFNIGQDSSTVSISCTGTFTYNGSPITPCTATASTGAPLTVTYSNNTSAGTAGASATFAGDANHAGSSNSTTFTIGQASSSVSIDCSGTFTYTGSAQTPCTATATGVGGLSQSLTVTYGSNTNAGTVSASASFSGDANHTGNSNSTTFSIGQAGSTVTVSCTGGPFTYTGSPITPCSATASTGATLTVNYSSNTNVGTATASATFAGDTNHTGSSSSATFPILGAILVVTSSADDSGTASNCTIQAASGTGTDASCSLRDALLKSVALSGGTISFDSTHFASASTITLSNGTLTIPATTMITGPTTGTGATLTNLVAVDGNSAYAPFTVGSAVTGASISNLTIQNGHSSGNGGGILNAGTLTLVNDTITGARSAGLGGGIYNATTGTLTVSDSAITLSTATSNGGGIWNAGILTLTSDTIAGNISVANGGGIYNAGTGILTLANDTVSGNVAHGDGGIYNANSSSTSVALANSILFGNSSQTGSDDYDGTAYTDKTGNQVGASNGVTVNATPVNLTALGNYGGPTQTMVPLPGSPAIGAGIVGNLTTYSVTADQRGNSYNALTRIDSGAAQTNYVLSFTTEPPATVPSVANFTAAVTLTESGSGFSGVTIPLTLSGTGTLSGGSAASGSNGAASYTLQVSAIGTGDTLTTNLSGVTAVTSSSFNVVVGPVITTQPTSQTVAAGTQATFNVAALGTGTVTYQWQYFNSNSHWVSFGAGTGTTTATLTTNVTSAAYNGLQLRVVVTDGNGATATSSTVTLTVGPGITTQPTNQTVAAGTQATFTVVASGTGTLTYQWQYFNINSHWVSFGAGTGTTTATMTTNTTTSAYNGLKLRVVVTDGNGVSTISNVATLTVGPAITTQPTSQTVATGNQATFSVVASGTGTLTYQWQYFNSNSHWVSFGAGTGTTTATLLTNATTSAYSGLNLRVVVTDGNGVSTISNTVTLTVANPPVITAQPTSSQSVTEGSTVGLGVTATGTPSLSYQWQFSMNGGSSYASIGQSSAEDYGFSNYATNSLTFYTSYLYGPGTVMFKVVVTDGNGLTATSSPATVIVTTLI